MRLNRKQKFIDSKNLFIFFFLILQTFFIEILSEECPYCQIDNENKNKCKGEEDNICQDCKPHLGTCYKCTNLNDNFFYITQEGECISKSSCDNKIIEETKECVGHCPNDMYELGDYCIYESDCIERYHREKYNDKLKICKCKFKYKIIEDQSTGNKKKYDCYSDNYKCDYYDHESKECIDEERCKYKKKKKNEENNEIRCSNECLDEEYYYTENGNEYCKKDQCPSGKEYYYIDSITNIRYCTNSCKDEEFYNGKECTNYCNVNDKIIIDLSLEKEKIKCSSSGTSQLTNYYKYENNYYFKNCSDTQKLKLFNYRITYNNENDEGKECVDDCNEKYIDEKTNSCIDCKNKFYYGKNCLDFCNEGYYIIKENPNVENGENSELGESNSPYECVEKCPIGYYIYEANKTCYKENCPKGFYINPKFECVEKCTKPTNDNSFNSEEGYIIELDEKLYCSSSCFNSGKHYYYINHNNTCVEKGCNEQEEKLFSAYDNPYTCYNSCKEIGEEYKYEKDYICYKTSLTCDSYYSIENNLMKCISYQDCLKDYKYIKGKQCVKDCDPNDYKSEYILNNNKEIESIGGCYSEPNDCINEGLIFFNKTEKVCRKTCNAYKISETTPIKNENGETCFSSCPSNYPYKDTTKLLCLEKCDKYYYGNDCLDNCQNKYHFEDSKECLDSCKIENKYYYEIKDSTDKICYYSCPPGYPYVEIATFNQKESYKCIDNCPAGKYYYEDKKICRDSCDILYKSENDNICVTQCSPDQKVKNEKYCIELCPSNTPYILKEKLSNLNSIIVDKCVSICPSGYPLISNSTNYCLKECPFSESYQYNGRCYKKCKTNTYADEISKKCFDNGCPSDFKYYEVDDEGVKICKISCPKDAYISQEGQCLKECPSDQNYIGGTNLCLKKCSNNYGEYYEKVKALNDYNIYRCLHSCSELTVYDTKECVSKENECPIDYYESPNNICYKECNLDEYYPFSTKDDNDKKVCAKKCHESQENYYKDNKKCTNECLESYITDYDGACVLKCTNVYYNYLENGKCVNKCSEKKYIKDYKCIDECPAYSYIEDNECRNECDSNHFSKEIMKDGVGTKVYECLTKCGKEDFYYETGSYSKKCLSSCNERDFIIQDTQICTSNCPKNYKSYFHSGMSIETYKDNTCVLNCPSDKPYVFSGKCLEECPTGNKFHIQGQTNCIANCPQNSKIVDGNECTSFCPNDKFLAHDNKTCINNCSDTSYKYYIEGINNCLEKCDQDYFIEDYKCVISCSENKPYLDGKICDNKCPDYYFVDIYNNNSCVVKCNNYYKNDTEKNIRYCINECEYSYPDGECLSKCNETYNYYNYENKTCLDKCPYYTLSMSDNNNKYEYKCYSKCPSEYPYIKGGNCVNDCDSFFLNITSNECQKNCEKKEYIDDSNKKFCIDDCEDFGLYKMGNKQCVKECKSDENNLIGNLATKTCECENYYYIDNEGIINCLPNDHPKNCQNDNNCEYKFLLYGTYEYVKNCNNNCLSADEKYCYTSKDQYPNFTIPTYENQNHEICKLKCSFNYYEEEDSSIICLSENEPCPSNYNYLSLENRQCVKQCDNEENIILGNYCLLKNTCENKKLFLFQNETFYNCKEGCDNEFPYEIEDLKQCLKNCSDTDYYILHNNRCISSCNNIENTIVKKKIKILDNGKEAFFYECAYSCKGDLWYKDGNDTICNEDMNIKTCERFNRDKPYLIKDTNECINECTKDYSFSFYKECFNKCEDIKKYYDYEIVPDNEHKICNCPNLWKIVDGKKQCMEKDISICYESDANKLISDTKQCTNECPTDDNYNIFFNNTCYKSCPAITTQINENTCQCKYKWYKYNDEKLNINDIIICFETEENECPKDSYPYFNEKNKQCLDDLSKCDSDTKIFNNICYEQCPTNTVNINDSNECQCDKNRGKWYKYINEGKIFLECGKNECPDNKPFTDYDSNECVYSCDNKYIYEKTCYLKCPENTKPVDELSKECLEVFTFNDPKDLTSLDENVVNNIANIYPKISKGGLVYNINNSTMQIYGINKIKSENQDLIIRSNLTYIDITSDCLEKIYEKNGLSDDTDIIMVKYDIGDKTDSYHINPVEYKIINSRTGAVIPLDICEDNSIVISYPLSNILKSYSSESKSLRNLEEDDKNTLNVREKFLKGKEIYIENEEIDSFNIESPLYTDMCYAFELNGKDLILEDRINYLYPSYSFCESNCIYNKTDFISERVYCNCSPKEGVNFGRSFEPENVNVDTQKVKNNQKGSVLKCLSKVRNISKNFGFFYGLIIFLAEIGLCILTFLYSLKAFIMRVKIKFDIRDDRNNNNIDTENIESINITEDKRYKKNNNNEEMVKTSERNMEYPPKKINKLNININNNNNNNNNNKKENSKKVKKEIIEEQNVIDIQELKIKKNTNNDEDDNKEKISQSNSENIYNEKSSTHTVMESEDENIFDFIKMEEKLLRVDYTCALKKNKAEILVIILSEILDKLYIIKAIFFIHKYEILSLYISIYLLWHMLIVSFLSLFYNNSTLHKIWIKDSYPNISYHLSFGFVTSILVFIIYRGLLFLITNDREIKKIESITKDNKNEIRQQFDKMMFWAKIKIIIFYAVDFILLFLFFLYIIAFCGIYNATMSHLIESYGIALIEIVIIKVLYGLVLGILRKVSLSYEINILYTIVRFLDTFIV